MKKRTIALIFLSAIAVSYSVGRYLQPEKVVVKEVEVIKRDVKTVVKTIKQPDGTIIRERTTEDKTQTNKSNETVVTNQGSKVRINAIAGWSFEHKKEIYGLMVQKDILGPISVGVFGMSDKTIGVTVGISF